MLNHSSALTVLRSVLTVIALIWIATYFTRYSTEILLAAAEFDTSVLGWAMVWVLIGLVPGAFAWQQLLVRDLPALHVLRGILVYLRSGIGKYTPGGMLCFAIQHRLLKSERVGMLLLLRVFLGTALVACTAALIVGIPAAMALLGPQASYWTVPVIVALVGSIALISRAKHWPLLSIAMDRIGVPPPFPFAKTFVVMAVAWILTGSHLAILGAETDAGMIFLISAYALSAIAGIVFAILPGAFIVRDGVLIMILATQLDPANAMILALLSRTLVVAGDVIGTVVAALVLRRTSPENLIERKFL